MRTEAGRYIEATKETRKNLEKALGCTDRMIRNALTYVSDTKLARKIRYIAVKEYGAVPMSHCPECETMHNVTEDGRQLMVQNFDNGVRLEIDKQTGAAVVYDRKGRVLETRQIERFPELSEVQLYAKSL
ncbi:MAG: hypothetical protein HDQ88_07370 [Clostridia bacterium]|nr:hypothetical protein [Clostridia bacterium]